MSSMALWEKEKSTIQESWSKHYRTGARTPVTPPKDKRVLPTLCIVHYYSENRLERGRRQGTAVSAVSKAESD